MRSLHDRFVDFIEENDLSHMIDNVEAKENGDVWYEWDGLMLCAIRELEDGTILDIADIYGDSRDTFEKQGIVRKDFSDFADALNRDVHDECTIKEMLNA
mgnify:CR=1 FL=1|tara:strand:- start:189 stop:488 length:300 start_codon:yes stop_codon:yes gene_type:complete